MTFSRNRRRRRPMQLFRNHLERPMLLRALVAVTVLGTSACSFLSMERAKRPKPEQAPLCTSSVKPIAVDVALAATFAAVATVTAREEGPSVYAGGGITVAALVVSAIDGFLIMRNCDRARARHDEWLQQRVAP
jgi:hypothetical protein